MPRLSLIPEIALGPFIIGSPIGDSLEYINKHGLSLRNNELSFDPGNPLSEDLCLNLVDYGLQLRFDPVSQRLRLIDVYDLSKVQLEYRGSICSENGVPSFQQIYKLFGPTYPGRFLEKGNTYLLQYPGVCFLFAIKQNFTVDTTTHLPVEYADGSSPIASRVYVHHGPFVANRSLPPLKKCNTRKSIQLSDAYFLPVLVYLKQGILITALDVSVGFQTSAQDLLVDLGPPESSWVKHKHDIVKIHTRKSMPGKAKDYMFNYFMLGMDFLIDGSTHCVKKILLHSNLIGTISFGRYRKCNFQLVLDGGKKVPPAEVASNVSQDQKKSTNVNEPKSFASTQSGDRGKDIDSSSYGVETKFSEFKRVLGECGPPMVNNCPRAENPFGATLFYAYDGILFQVADNDLLVNITLFGLQ
eukprot:gb/GEZN01003440.1/.p1 GENE.gb/GEZN01003440.1/~~gb/GEZN01003440.1/.p1  ORF type:complete len:414 (+),score=35.72 gb/GEZN01003440.1/:447-1688(+)